MAQYNIHKVRLTQAGRQALKTKKHPIELHKSETASQVWVSDQSLSLLKEIDAIKEVVQTLPATRMPIEVSYSTEATLFDPPDPDALSEVCAYALGRLPKFQEKYVSYLGRASEGPKDAIKMDRPGGSRAYWWRLSKHKPDEVCLKDRFPNIIQAVQDPQTKVILSFGSGGIRLFAQPSLMKFLDVMLLKPYVDEIWGCSGGAISGLMYALGVAPREIEEEGYNIYNQRYSFRLSPSKFEVLKNIMLESFSSDRYISGFMDCQKMLRELLGKHIEQRKTEIPFYCTAYNVKTKQTEILTPEPLFESRYQLPIYQTSPLDAVTASSSIPIVYAPKIISRGKVEQLYVDGATTEEMPLVSPYAKWNEDRKFHLEKRDKLLIISVNLFTHLSATPFFKSKWYHRLPAFHILKLSAELADHIREAHINEHKNFVLQNPQVTLWEIHPPLEGIGVLDTRRIPEIIQITQQFLLSQLDHIEAQLSSAAAANKKAS